MTPMYVLKFKNESTKPFQRVLGREPYTFDFVENLVKNSNENFRLTGLIFPSFEDWQQKINQGQTFECYLWVNGKREVYYVERVQ